MQIWSMLHVYNYITSLWCHSTHIVAQTNWYILTEWFFTRSTIFKSNSVSYSQIFLRLSFPIWSTKYAKKKQSCIWHLYMTSLISDDRSPSKTKTEYCTSKIELVPCAWDNYDIEGQMSRSRHGTIEKVLSQVLCMQNALSQCFRRYGLG